LQIATYSATPAALAAPAVVLSVVLGVDAVPVLACVLAVEAVVAACVLGVDAVVAAGVELLGVELPPLLPHPAKSAPESSATASSGDRFPIIGPP
jgi:hypothetical protein